MIAIYNPHHSNRTKYVFDHIFEQQLGVGYLLLNAPVLNNDAKVNINYSATPYEGWLNIQPSGFLNQTGIEPFEPSFKMRDQLPILFANNSALGYDVFSAIFYCLTRYEEYLEMTRDEHGRFSYQSSILYKQGYLQTPLVDYWINDLRDFLALHSKDLLNLKSPENVVQPTIDIDSVFAYKGKGLKRQLGGLMRDLLGFNGSGLKTRLDVFLFNQQDPFDNFDYQLKVLRANNLKAQYFVQVGAYGVYDKNISPTHTDFQTILKRLLKEGHGIGLHPSYASFLNTDTIAHEKAILEKMIGTSVVKSRQHYLRFALPKTFEGLIELGIQEEYSMGYSEVPGFRAATSQPFYWYNLEKEMGTSLKLFPFAAMDVAYKQFKKLKVQEAIHASKDLCLSIKATNGRFCFVYHNESLSNNNGWNGWRTLFENWLQPWK